MRLMATAFSFAILALSRPAMAQHDMANVEVTAQVIKPGVAVLFGEGGNIGVGYGEDGTVLVDDQFAPLTEKIQAAVAGLGAPEAKFLINTHWHYDHTGGNANFAAADATILAHENVRIRLVEGGMIADMKIEPADKEALPIITYGQGVTLHLNDETIDIRFLGGGHTDGDSVVLWRKANVIHTGDLFVSQMGFPFADLSSGGNIEHLLSSLAQVIAIADEKTVIIPGHGPLGTRADLVAFRDMVATGVDRVKALQDRGLTLEAAKAQKPLQGLRNADGFVSDDLFVEAVWGSLDKHRH